MLAGVVGGIFWVIRRNKKSRRSGLPPDGVPGEQSLQETKPHHENQAIHELPPNSPAQAAPGQVVVNGRFLAEVPG